MTLNVIAPIKLAIVTFYKADYAVNRFLSCFHNSLKHKEIIACEKQCNEINQLTRSFREIREKFCNCIMLVTHGEKDTGSPTYEETKSKPGLIDKELVENWIFISKALYGAGVDCLGFFTICYSGKHEIVDLMTRGEAQFLHVITSAPDLNLEVEKGAKAMALFLDFLVDMEKNEYTSDDLKLIEKEVNQKHPNVIKLWLYGDTLW